MYCLDGSRGRIDWSGSLFCQSFDVYYQPAIRECMDKEIGNVRRERDLVVILMHIDTNKENVF